VTANEKFLRWCGQRTPLLVDNTAMGVEETARLIVMLAPRARERIVARTERRDNGECRTFVLSDIGLSVWRAVDCPTVLRAGDDKAEANRVQAERGENVPRLSR